MLDSEALTHKSFYTQKFLHREVLLQRNFDTQKFLRREVFLQRGLLHTEVLTLHTGPFTQTSLYTEEHFYTQKLLHREVSTTQRSFYTLLRRQVLTQRRQMVTIMSCEGATPRHRKVAFRNMLVCPTSRICAEGAPAQTMQIRVREARSPPIVTCRWTRPGCPCCSKETKLERLEK